MSKRTKVASKNVLINFVLDKSGSMYPVVSDTIGGFNRFCKEQKSEGEKLGQKTSMSLTLFDTEFELRYVNTDIDSIPPLSEKNYQPGGNTALYDAIGASVRAVEEQGVDAKVLFIILTDGLENSSMDWTQEAIFDLITQKRAKDAWEFVFMGADQDAYLAGGRIGIASASTLSYAGDQSIMAYAAASMAASAWRSGETEEMDISAHQKEFERTHK